MGVEDVHVMQTTGKHDVSRAAMMLGIIVVRRYESYGSFGGVCSVGGSRSALPLCERVAPLGVQAALPLA